LAGFFIIFLLHILEGDIGASTGRRLILPSGGRIMEDGDLSESTSTLRSTQNGRP
jgi:hypothetical protein